MPKRMNGLEPSARKGANRQEATGAAISLVHAELERSGCVRKRQQPTPEPDREPDRAAGTRPKRPLGRIRRLRHPHHRAGCHMRDPGRHGVRDAVRLRDTTILERQKPRRRRQSGLLLRKRGDLVLCHRPPVAEPESLDCASKSSGPSSSSAPSCEYAQLTSSGSPSLRTCHAPLRTCHARSRIPVRAYWRALAARSARGCRPHGPTPASMCASRRILCTTR